MRHLLVGSFLLLVATASYGQQATLTAEGTRLVAGGGTLKFVATVAYDQAPKALGWLIKLPPGWSLQQTGGAQAPEIAPVSGTTTTLEWAYLTVPASTAQFEFTACYPAEIRQDQRISAELLTCSDGRTATIAVAGPVLRPSPSRSSVRPRPAEIAK